MQPKDFLKEAISTVDQRGTDNGYDTGQERSAAKVAAVYNAITGQVVTEADVWTMLICLKLVRNRRRYKKDNIVDLAGYAGLLGECLEAEHGGPVAGADRLQMVMDSMGYLSPADIDTLRDILREPDGKVSPKDEEAFKVNGESFQRFPLHMQALRDKIQIATGEELDYAGSRLMMERKEFTGVTAAGGCRYPEPDAAFRDRLLECLRQIEDVHTVAACPHDSYEQLGPGERRCCDCGARFEGHIEFNEE